MNNNLTAKVSIQINAPIEKVWEALTDPKIIKQYFFGVDLITTWEIGSEMIYKGEWEGKSFEEKGTVLKVEKPHLLVSNYWSPSFGPDTPENRQVITYELSEENGITTLNLTQEGSKTEEGKEHSEANWKMVLEGMKKLLES